MEPSAVRTNMLELTDHHVEHLAIVASGKVIFVVPINAQLKLGTAAICYSSTGGVLNLS